MKKYKNNENMKLRMKNSKKSVLFVLAFAMVLVMQFASANTLESYGTKKVNEQFTFCQVCADSTYITLSSIETPNSTISLNANMTSTGSGEFCYNYTPNQLGRYDFRGISDGCEKTFATYIEVTTRGEQYNNSQQGLIIAQGIFIALFVALGFSFSKDKWKIRGFFFMMALLVGVLMLNSIRILAGSSATLDSMVNIGLIVGMISVSFMAIYLLIIYTIELFKSIKSKKEAKWEVSDRFN